MLARMLRSDRRPIIGSTPIRSRAKYAVWTGRFYLADATAIDPNPHMELLSLDRSGVPIASARPLDAGTPGVLNPAAMAWNGAIALLAWTNGSQNAPEALEVVGALANADATSISPVITIPSSSNLQVAPEIATSGSQDLAVWAEPTGIYATRITPDGRALDGRGITVSSATPPSRSLTLTGVPSPSRPVEPAVRAIDDGSSYLVAWSGSTGVTAQRVDPATGSLVGPPIALAPCSQSFDLAKDNDSPVLFTVDCSDGRVYAQRVGAAAPVGAAVAISPSAMLATAPRAAWNGNEWLVVWNKLVQSPLLISPPFYYAPAVYAARVSTALTLLDVQPIPIAESEFSQEDAPLVASDGREFLVVWSHREFNAGGLYLRRVQPDGSVREAEVLLSGSIAAKSIVWSGARYTIGYSRSDGSWNEDLFLTHVSSRNDEPLIHDEVTISATAIDERYISLSASAGRPVRVVYTRVATEPQYGGVSRVFMRDEIARRAAGRFGCARRYASAVRHARNHGSRRPNFVASATPMPKIDAALHAIVPTTGIKRIAPRISTPTTTIRDIASQPRATRLFARARARDERADRMEHGHHAVDLREDREPGSAASSGIPTRNGTR